MASSHCSIARLCLLLVFCFISAHSTSSTSHYYDEQESVYQVLEAINSDIDWRSLFPDDFCVSAPHGIVCEYFSDENDTVTPHITELNFGSVSDYSPNPPCSFNSTLSPLLSSFTYLRKLFFYQCFTETMVSFPWFLSTLGSTLEELVFIDNPSLVGTLSGNLGNLTRLRRFILSGTSVSGAIPDEIGGLLELQQVTISRNCFHGIVPQSLGNLKKLKVLDLSYNGLEGNLPESIGKMTELVKLDLGSNHFDGGIPESLVGLQELEFLDLSYNRFGNFGIPLFLAEMPSLREVYLSGNPLGGQIPEIWEKLGGILGLGLSGLGLVGKIPASMGVFLRNVCFLVLDQNKLEGTVPDEFGLLESVHEMNLENNKLSGKLPFSANFSARIRGKLKLAGNPNLCIDGDLSSAQDKSSLGYLKSCNKPNKPDAVLFSFSESSSPVNSSLLLIIFLGLFLTFCL
ncbi:piriformospora indica-insensitive protein 2 [Telopea speciosissima]|uniref:piriformospora indica-insensitive protein 2 n=1 Tax=Telopea speciosissima TaxID=54955 RepID=UPI001CC50ACA|nr:piriformospora indica-insensitive protein 2 [Telopea speciosissima]